MSKPRPTTAAWRDRLTSWWRDYRWLLVGMFALIAFTLGYIGFDKHLTNHGLSHNFRDILYITLQLIALEFNAPPGPVPWELEVARFALPAVVAYAALEAFALIFREQLDLLRLRSLKKHVVVCGLGEKGSQLVREFRQRGSAVVAIELDAENDLIRDCREAGATVLIGNARSSDMLHRARVRRAKYLICVCGEDGANAEIAVHADGLTTKRKGEALACLVHVVDPRLCALLREKELSAQSQSQMDLEFFNVFESGARIMLREHPAFHTPADNRPPHILVVGVGRLGESLTVQLARLWREEHGVHENARLRVTLIDQAAQLKKEFLTRRYRHMEEICDLTALTMDINTPAFHEADFLFNTTGECDITQIYICFDDDAFGLSTALALYQNLRGYDVPIVVRMAHDGGLGLLLQAEDSFDNLYAFGLLDRTCTPALLLSATLEVLARAHHEEWLRQMQIPGDMPQNNPNLVPWDQLPESVKASNRHEVHAIGQKLQAIGCKIAPLTDWNAEFFQFTPDEIERMAEMEHDRWMKEKLAAGWCWGPQTNTEEKRHKDLLLWREHSAQEQARLYSAEELKCIGHGLLPDEEKEKDRITAKRLPVMLAKVGFEVFRSKKMKGNGP